MIRGIRHRPLVVLVVLGLIALLGLPAAASTTAGALHFSNTPLLRPEGGSEPAITIGANGKMVMTSLQWLFDPTFFGTHVWKGSFGSTPGFKGLVDAGLQHPAKTVFGSGDADVDLGSTGTLHFTSLVFLVNKPGQSATFGVSAITCPNADTSNNFANCTKKIIDTAGADRPWITSDGKHVWISYHDAGNSSLIHVQRSDDDGITWHKVGDQIVGQDGATGDATFNNDQVPIVADPTTHDLFDIYAAGEPSIQKGTTANFNNIFVSRSRDLGSTWRAVQVFHAPLNTALNNVFPALAVDPVTGRLYAAWSDAHDVMFSVSSDHGRTWSAAVTVNIAPAATALFPWLAAYGGTVDLVYYGTTGSSKDDTTAVWNTYLAQTTNGGASFTQSRVSNTSNHTGVICTEGIACAEGTRNLLDLFEVAIDPLNGKAAVIYVDDTLTKDSDGNPLPQVVLAQQT